MQTRINQELQLLFPSNTPSCQTLRQTSSYSWRPHHVTLLSTEKKKKKWRLRLQWMHDHCNWTGKASPGRFPVVFKVWRLFCMRSAMLFCNAVFLSPFYVSSTDCWVWKSQKISGFWHTQTNLYGTSSHAMVKASYSILYSSCTIKWRIGLVWIFRSWGVFYRVWSIASLPNLLAPGLGITRTHTHIYTYC